MNKELKKVLKRIKEHKGTIKKYSKPLSKPTSLKKLIHEKKVTIHLKKPVDVRDLPKSHFFR